MKRKKARENAFIAIFESFFYSGEMCSFPSYIEENQDLKLCEYSKKLVLGVLEKREELDLKINSYLKNWEFKRVSKILIAILEISFYEILYVDDVDFPVSINEAVELAKKYFGDEGPSFVNGVLGNFVKTI